MNIYLLDRGSKSTSWDECQSMVVIAESESSAREVAAENHSDEGAGVWCDNEITVTLLGTALGSQKRGMIIKHVQYG